MKKLLSVIFSAILILIGVMSFIPVSAADTSFEGIYTFQILNNEAVITKCASSATGEIVLPETLGNCPVTSIGDNAFERCGGIEKITLSGNIKSIGQNAFNFCYEITEIILPESLNEIKNGAFTRCILLQRVNIPKNVASVGIQVFSGCNSLYEITVDSENGFFSSENGVLYDKEKTNLICYPTLKSLNIFTVPESVKIISKTAFYGNEYLNGIILPKNLEEICDQAFTGCTSLRSLNIPASVEKIGDKACKDCDSIEVIEGYYNTAARAFAEKNSISFKRIPLYCDASGNGVSDSEDLAFLKKEILGSNTVLPSPDADCNADETIDLRDIVHMKKYFADKK